MDLSGIYAPIAVPFTESGQIDEDSLGSNLEKWGNSDLGGIVFPGSNSESPFLTEEEKIGLWNTCITAMHAKGKKIIAGTGMESTEETIRLNDVAVDLGADAALIIPPYFYKPAMSHAVLLEHYLRVADRSSIPILLYNVPAYSGIDFQTETVVKLSEHPNIIGMKDSSSNVIKSSLILAKKPGFKLFCGTAGSLLPFLSIGAVGGIMALANFSIEPCVRLYKAFHAGDRESAKAIQHRITAINTAVTARFGVAGLKYAMNQCGFHGGYPRRPLLPVDDNIQAIIDELLMEAGLG